MGWFLLLLFPSLALCSLVKTPFGEIEGFEHQTENGISTHIFLGIRYGHAPEKHFTRAEMVEKWAPAVHSAKEYGAACYPAAESAIRVHGDNYSEDCLFLNIITPSLTGKDLPVFFFIHGGGYAIGASHHYKYACLAERVASEGIVVVTINYRLGPFGFFSLGDSNAPGNMGLWDQTLALRFLNEIVSSFGGDPSRITVAGHSAGSASVSALQFSSHSNKFFTQSILMSGSTLSELLYTQNVVNESRKLAKELGCETESTAETLVCVQQRTPIEIIKAADKLGATRPFINMLKYQPRFDGDFFPHEIEQLARRAPKIRSLAGVVDQESAVFLFYGISELAVPPSRWSNYSRDELIQFIENVVVSDEEHGNSAGAFRRLLVEFYVEKGAKRGDSVFYLQRMSELVSDLQFYIPLYHETLLKLAHDWPSYLYILHHDAKQSPRDRLPVKGTYHGDEVHSFSDNTLFYPVMENDHKYEKFGANFVSAIINFVKNGDPSSPSFSWPAVTKERPFQHVSISENINLQKEAFREGAARLWLETIPTIVPGKMLRATRLPGAAVEVTHTEL